MFMAGTEPSGFADVLAHEVRRLARQDTDQVQPSPAYWDVLPHRA